MAMCCSVSPGVRVEFRQTVLYAAEVEVEGWGLVHVLGYQNEVQNGIGGFLPDGLRWVSSLRGRVKSPKLTSIAPGPSNRSRKGKASAGNAMILPFPARHASMTSANVLETKACRDILQDMALAVAPPLVAAMPRSAGRSRAASVPPVQIFKSGIYTVVLAQDPRDIPDAIERVPQSTRPDLNPALFEAYGRWYPGWTVALCCFNNKKAALADPMLWWYEPLFRDQLFLPALDCHTGDVPDRDADVKVDHVLAVGSHRMKESDFIARVHYRDRIPAAIAPYLRERLIGGRFRRSMPNGDFVCKLSDVIRGEFEPIRTRPGVWDRAGSESPLPVGP
jgi:hypothetical protein